jgi:hypothetical protein
VFPSIWSSICTHLLVPQSLEPKVRFHRLEGQVIPHVSRPHSNEARLQVFFQDRVFIVFVLLLSCKMFFVTRVL